MTLQRVISASGGTASIRADLTLDGAHEAARDFYKRIGGESTFRRLAEEFYRRVSADSLLAPLFEGSWERHARRLAHHFVAVYGTPDLLQAWEPYVLAAHTKVVITHEQRLRWLALMEEAGRAIEAPEPEFSDLIAVLGVASLDMMAASRGAALARGERIDRLGARLPDPLGTDED